MTTRSMYVFNGSTWDEVGYTIAHDVPAGGATGTVLSKSSATDYDAAWVAQSALTVAQSQVTNLTTDLSAKAPLASPTFTGVPAAPTAAVDTSTTQIATTAFTVAQIADDAVLKTVADAAGDLVVGSAADTFGRLALGTDNHVLTVDTAGSGVAKVGWEDPTANPLTTAAMALKVNTATVGNLLTANQASIETDTTGFNNPSSCTLTRSTTAGTFLTGTASLAATFSGTAFAFFTPLGTAGVAVTPGQTYHAQVSAKAGTNSAKVYIAIRFYNGASSLGDSAGSDVTVTTSAWTTARATFVAPATATHATVVVASGVGGVTNGDVYYFDCLGFWEGAGGQWALPGTPITNLGFYTDESVGRRLFQWDPNNNRWQMTYGDTGWRDVTSLVDTSGWTNAPTALAVYVRRTLEHTSMIVQWNPGTGSCSGQGVVTLPSGFGPAASIIAPGGSWQSADAGAYTGGWYWETGTKLDLQSPATSVYLRAIATLPCTAAWPTSLPGSAVGSIPA